MTESQNALVQLSQALVAQTAAAAQLVAAVRISPHRHLSGLLWQPNVVLTSEQSLPAEQEFEVVLPDGSATQAKMAGRDPGTNAAVLKLEHATAGSRPRAAQPRVGELVLVYGAAENGDVRARMGIVSSAGPQWYSRAGGRIDARIVLDVDLARCEEGGPVFNAAGELIGMSTYGGRGEALVIPAATLDRVVPPLLSEGHVPRGWLGVALQPIAVPSALREAAGQESGMMVMSLAENGPGAGAGIMAGDIVLTIDGVAAVRMHKVAAQLDADSIGRAVELRFIRGGAVTSVEVLVSKRPAA